MFPAFELHSLSYGEILDIPALKIPTGSIFCITGESGSGKTTLLRMLNNLIPYDRGQIKYRGSDILTLDPVALRRRVMMVPQSSYVFPGTAAENMLKAFSYAGRPAPKEEEMDQILISLGLEGMLHKNTANFSGGEKQRLSLARVLLLDPETLLLDEPTAALDEVSQDKVMLLIKQLVKTRGKTVVMITHALRAADKYGEQILTLKKGKILALKSQRGEEH